MAFSERDLEERLERLVRQHAGALLRFCLERIPDRQSAEDAAQDAMMRTYEKMATGFEPEEPLSYLFGVARRCCLERSRSAPVEALEARDPEARSEADRAGDELGRLLATLSDREQALIYLKHNEGLRCREIAERMGQPVGSVTSALTRIYGKLREAAKGEER